MKEIQFLIAFEVQHKLYLSEGEKILDNFIVRMQIEIEHFANGILSYAY